MATSLVPSFCSLTTPSYKPKLWKYPQARSQSFHDEVAGKSANKVDANLSVLKERIRDLRRKERLERLENGWNYKTEAAAYDMKHKTSACAMLMLSESITLAGLVSSALGIVFLSGSFCILLVSFVVHLYH